MPVEKVCPVVLRRKGESIEVLAFRHPTAGYQLVKGTIEPGEDPTDAAIRELAEESGIASLSSIEFKGTWNAEYKEQTWHFYRCEPLNEFPDEWTFFTEDGGGLNFEFFWFDLTGTADEEWNDVFVRALEHIRQNF